MKNYSRQNCEKAMPAIASMSLLRRCGRGKTAYRTPSTFIANSAKRIQTKNSNTDKQKGRQKPC